MEKSITELLVRSQIAFETIPGHHTGETKFRIGLCDTHKRSVSASNRMEDYNVTLSNAAVLLDYVKDGQLSCAGSSDRVYLELQDKGGDAVWCYAEMDGEYPRVYEKASDTICVTAALAVLAILTVPDIRKSYLDVIAAMRDPNVDYEWRDEQKDRIRPIWSSSSRPESSQLPSCPLKAVWSAKRWSGTGSIWWCCRSGRQSRHFTGVLPAGARWQPACACSCWETGSGSLPSEGCGCRLTPTCS